MRSKKVVPNGSAWSKSVRIPPPDPFKVDRSCPFGNTRNSRQKRDIMMEPDTNIKPATAEMTVSSVEGTIVPCSLEELESHLRAFIAAFILPRAQARWLEFLIDRRQEWDVSPRSPHDAKVRWKAGKVMRQFAADKRYCLRISNAQSKEAYYDSAFGKAPGVYFEMGTPPCKLTANQAFQKFVMEDDTALLSFQAGKKALFFLHSGGAWRCEK